MSQKDPIVGFLDLLQRAVLGAPDWTDEFDLQDIAACGLWPIAAYFGILFFVPLAARPASRYARFHANQGLVFFIAMTAANVAMWFVRRVLRFLFVQLLPLSFISGLVGWVLSTVIGLASLGMLVVGVWNAYNGRAKELPFIGGLRWLK